MMDRAAIDNWWRAQRLVARAMYRALLEMEKADALPGGDPLEPARRAIEVTERLTRRIAQTEQGRRLLASDPPAHELDTFGPPGFQQARPTRRCDGCRALAERGITVLACSECDEQVAP